MKSSTRLDSVVFQLTPTRTRCDLVINVNGKTEKIASGLLSPFLAHLKSAQEQMAKGGYSIILEPGPRSDVAWFTKGTVEMFVRFVSTPEVLERVYTLESEISQIEEAIAIQNKNDTGLSTVEEHKPKPRESIEGNRSMLDINEEKAIVLYEPGANPSEANGPTSQEQSRVQLLKVLETRKTVLQKEQGMAFARAVAAGFDIDHMAALISFAECFGASRLMEACRRYMELWKRKHETGQWLEIEAAEAITNRSEFSAMNGSGVMLSNVPDKQKELGQVCKDATNELASDNNGTSTGERPIMDHQALKNHQEYFQGQFPQQMFPPWPIHSPPGTFPVFPGYPMQGMPYYQNYPGSGPYIAPSYSPSEDPRLNGERKMRRRRHSMDSRDGNTESGSWEINAQKEKSKDDTELDKEASHEGEYKKGSHSGKRQSGVLVIRNLNYITSKRQDSSGSDSQSDSGSDIDEDGDLHGSSPVTNHKDSLRSSKRKDRHAKSVDTLYGKEEDTGHWQAFQNCLLGGANEDNRAVNQDLFAAERSVKGKKQQNRAGDDPLVYNGQYISGTHEDNMKDIHQLSGNITPMPRASVDMLLISKGARHSAGGDMDAQTAEMYSRRGAYKTTANDEFMVDRQRNQAGFTSSSDPLAINKFESRTHSLDGKMAQNVNDDSYIIPLRSLSHDQVGTDCRNTIDVDSELPSAQKQGENLTDGYGRHSNYEPNDLCLMPERGTEKGSISYDPALDYDMQAIAEEVAMRGKKNEAEGKRVSKSDKDRKSKLNSESSDKKKNVGPIRRGKPSKLSPLEEARARAEKLRSYKADLQRMKKEKEEENMKRLEALKLERQKRIAARGSSIPAQSTLPKQQPKKQVPAKVSPTSLKASKFSDAEPGSLSPLQRSIKFTVRSSDAQKTSKTSRLTASNSGGNRLTQSGSSLPKSKKDNNESTPDTKASLARIRRLSEPKPSSNNHLVSSAKSRSAESTSKSKVSNGTESKKISAIMKLDKSKAETLPELKIKTPRKKDITQGILARKESVEKVKVKESIEKVKGTESLTTKGAEPNSKLDKTSSLSYVDDNPVIEKTVVMLECQKPSLPQLQASEGKTGVQKGCSNDKSDIGDTPIVSNYPAIHAPVSPFTRDKADNKPFDNQFHVQPSSFQVKEDKVEKESPKISSANVTEKPYKPPYARVSSLEDPCTTNSADNQATIPNLVAAAAGKKTASVHEVESKAPKVEKIAEPLEKLHVRESSKGLKRILKFGRKSHSSSASGQSEPDNVSVGGPGANENTTDVNSSVHTLKNLISQDETPTASTTPQKSSRTFSLLSPFRSKASGKKQTA